MSYTDLGQVVVVPGLAVVGYDLPAHEMDLRLPVGARALGIGVLRAASTFSPVRCPCLWALIDPGEKRVEPLRLRFVTTGSAEIAPLFVYLGTIDLSTEAFELPILHAFAEGMAS